MWRGSLSLLFTVRTPLKPSPMKAVLGRNHYKYTKGTAMLNSGTAHRKRRVLLECKCRRVPVQGVFVPVKTQAWSVRRGSRQTARRDTADERVRKEYWAARTRHRFWCRLGNRALGLNGLGRLLTDLTRKASPWKGELVFSSLFRNSTTWHTDFQRWLWHELYIYIFFYLKKKNCDGSSR